jgi:hypothetical protein
MTKTDVKKEIKKLQALENKLRVALRDGLEKRDSLSRIVIAYELAIKNLDRAMDQLEELI